MRSSVLTSSKRLKCCNSSRSSAALAEQCLCPRLRLTVDASRAINYITELPPPCHISKPLVVKPQCPVGKFNAKEDRHLLYFPQLLLKNYLESLFSYTSITITSQPRIATPLLAAQPFHIVTNRKAQRPHKTRKYATPNPVQGKT